MASNNNSSKVMVPEAREALNRFKMEAASEVGVQPSLKIPLNCCCYYFFLFSFMWFFGVFC